MEKNKKQNSKLLETLKKVGNDIYKDWKKSQNIKISFVEYGKEKKLKD
jgi:hypothetical protein